MLESSSLDAILTGGLDALLNPVKRRKQAAQDLPLLAIQRVRFGFTDNERDFIVGEFIEKIWDLIEEERGDVLGRGWDELTIGAAIALEILIGDGLPRRIEKSMQSRSEQDQWRALRTRYQQFVLTIDHSVKLQRILKLEDGTTFVDGPQFRGKSHTLMEALLVRNLLQDIELPVAATGEFCAQDGRILPVSNLVEKAIKWWTTKPDGLFISCVPTNEELKQILEHFPNRVDGKSVVDSNSPHCTTATDSWIVGASIQEIECKLKKYREKRTVRMWDGSEYETYLLPRTRFEKPPEERITPYMVFSEVARQQYAEFNNQQESKGLLLIGGPGYGKSIYSRVLESTLMVQGALGQLGFGIRSTAKTLGQYLSASPGNSSWLAFFENTGEHDSAFLEALTKTRRLVPIIDGLDEVSPEELEFIKSWLSQGSGIWIAFSRPISRLGDIPNTKYVKFAALEKTDAVALLSLSDKHHFAAWWHEQPSYEKTPIQTLGMTPLHLTMIAHVYSDPDVLPSASDVYSRIFADWLDRAVREGRLDEEVQEQLKSLLPLFIGEVALHWLQTEKPHIERSLIDQQFESAGPPLNDRGPLLKALASVNLLLPDGNVYALGHRTFAEYAAACALRQRVVRNNTDTYELEALAFALQDGLLHKSRWKTLLTFYAPYIQHPHALLKRFVGVDSLRDPNVHFESVQSYEFGNLWSFALELTSQCRCWSPGEACATWSTALRLWLFANAHNMNVGIASLRSLGETLGEHLPKTFDGHIQLLENEQQTQLREVGLALLDAMPVTIHEDLKVQLLSNECSKDDAVKIMTWLERLECSPPESDLDILIQRWAEGSTVRRCVWALCLLQSPHLLDHHIIKMLRQEDLSCSDLIRRWFVVEAPSNPYKATEHYMIRRDALDLILDIDRPWSVHKYIEELSQGALNEIVGRLWEDTPPGNRGAIEDLLRYSKRIPSQCRVGDVISMHLHNKSVHESDGILSMQEWFKNHEDALRTYVQEASGQCKFAAVVLLASVENGPEIEALAKHLGQADEEYSELAYERIRTLSDSEPEDPLPKSVEMSRMSLLVRATQEFGSWKLELLESLAKGCDTELLQLVAKKKIREALPILRSSLEERSWRHESDLLPCIASLMTMEDTELGRDAMRYALFLAWTYKSEEKRHRFMRNQVAHTKSASLAPFLCLDDLEMLTEQDNAVEAGSLLAVALQNLGKPAFDKLLALYRMLKASYDEAVRTPAFSVSEKLSKWEQGAREREKKSSLDARVRKLNSLAETIVNSVTTKTIEFHEFVECLFEIVPGDTHFIFSSFGGLGKDFTEPYDLDWHSSQQNESLIEAVDLKISQYRLDGEASLDTLRALFRHPSETLRLAVFQRCMELAAPHEVARLANEAIAGHFRHNDTQWEGDVAMYNLSGRAGEAGQSSVISPPTLRSLLKHLEKHITKHHWDDVITPLLGENDSLLRLLGVRLARGVGNVKNFNELEKMLVDDDILVMSTALSCLIEWRPTAVPELLLNCQGGWTAAHTREALRCFIRCKKTLINLSEYLWSPRSQELLGRVKTLPPYDWKIHEPLLRQLPPQTVVALLDRAAQQLMNEEDSKKTVFSGFPSPADRFIEYYQGEFADELEMLRSWSAHSHPSVRDVGVRWLCLLGEFDEQRIVEMSKGSTNLERLSCVEAVILTNNETLHAWALNVTHAATQYTSTENHSSSEEVFLPEQNPPYWDYWKRVLWALQFSSPTFADMLVPFAERLDVDIDGLLSAESEKLCRCVKLLALCWGEHCILPILDLLDEGKLDQAIYYYADFQPLTPQVIEAIRSRAGLDEPREFSRQLWDTLNSRDVFADRETLATELELFVCF